MVQPLHAVFHMLKQAAIALLFLGGLGLAGYLPFGDRPSLGDDWRRTAHGWERIDQWSPPPAHRSDSNHQSPANAIRHAASGRLDTHPAVLALAELVGVLVALWSFPATSPGSGRFAGGCSAFLARSFRASAFGS